MYPKMCERADLASAFNVVSFAEDSQHISDLEWQFNVTMVLRQEIFPRESLDIAVEEKAFHSVGYLGDAPVAVLRWRLVDLPGTWITSELKIALIDRVGVKPTNIRQGFASRLIEAALRDIAQRRDVLIISAVMIVLSQEIDWAFDLLKGRGWQHVETPPEAIIPSTSNFRFALAAPSFT